MIIWSNKYFTLNLYSVCNMGHLISSDFAPYLELRFHNPAGLCLEILMMLVAASYVRQRQTQTSPCYTSVI